MNLDRAQFAYNGDGARTSKTVSGDTAQYVLDLAATLPVVVSGTRLRTRMGEGVRVTLSMRRKREEATQ